MGGCRAPNWTLLFESSRRGFCRIPRVKDNESTSRGDVFLPWETCPDASLLSVVPILKPQLGHGNVSRLHILTYYGFLKHDAD